MKFGIVIEDKETMVLKRATYHKKPRRGKRILMKRDRPKIHQLKLLNNTMKEILLELQKLNKTLIEVKHARRSSLFTKKANNR